MTLDDLGNIGELVGALGVIASLFYLAVQVRHNTRALKATGYQSVLAAALPRDAALIQNRDVARLLIDGLAGRALAPEDFVRFHTFLHSVFRFFDSMYYQYRSRTLDAEHWETHRRAIHGWATQPAFRDWWEAFRGSFTPSFQELMGRELAALDDAHRDGA